MKKNILRKIGVISLAVAVSMSMGITAFAVEDETGANETTSNETTMEESDFTEAPSNGTSFDIEKEIMLYNDENVKVYGPGITYNYTVAPSDLAGKVTDSDNDSIVVKKGVEGGVVLTDPTAEFEKNAPVDVNSEGVAIKGKFTAKVELEKFKAAGVYRFAVKETKPDEFGDVGMSRPDGYDDTRYLDVYIGNAKEGGFEVIGYILFAKDIESGKTTGFVDAIGSGEASTGHADKYYTYNYSITKLITGTLADKTHPFPFKLTTAGAADGQKFSVTSTGTLQFGVEEDVAKIGTDVGVQLADNMTITIKGLPANTTFNVTESNDSPDVYHVSIADNAKEEAIADAVDVDAGTDTAIAEDNVALTDYTADQTVAPTAAFTGTTFTNTLNDVSPTNVVTRYAPFLFIIAAAILLLVFMRRRKSKDEE